MKYYSEKKRTWKDNWLDIIRDVIFPDEKLREQMLLPDDVSITQFIDKYFIEDEVADEIITDEAVRITYYNSRGMDTTNANVREKFLEFDIFVKKDVQHTATKDRLQNRYDLIAERLKYLLLRGDRVLHMKYRYEDEYNLYTKLIGYRRYHLVFSYKISI